MPEDRSDEFLDKHLPGDAPAIRALRTGIFKYWHRHAAGRVHCVLVTGETGTGKYQMAKLMVQHAEWSRQGGGIVPSREALARATANLTLVLLTAVPDAQAETRLVHRLLTDEDIELVRKDLLSGMPEEIRDGERSLQFPELIRSLDDGQCVITSSHIRDGGGPGLGRTFVLNVRPRVCVHGGEAE